MPAFFNDRAKIFLVQFVLGMHVTCSIIIRHTLYISMSHEAHNQIISGFRLGKEAQIWDKDFLSFVACVD